MSLQAHRIFFRHAVHEAFRMGGKQNLVYAKQRFSERNGHMAREYKSAQPGSHSRHNYAESIRALYRLELLAAAKRAEVHAYI